MKHLLKFLISSIVENPQDVVIEERQKEGFLELKLKTNPKDLKIVIGKKGKTIRAIRQLLRIKGKRQGKKVYLTLEE